jgi:type I restriction enzyme S subunit
MKSGYKQTEVGIIPEEWETRPCSEVSERIMVGIVIRPTQYYVNNGVPAFRSANIREDGINDLDLVYISDESNAVLAKSQTRTGDVLTVRTGYPGTSAVVHSHHAGCNCIDILITRPTKEMDSEWLAIWINSPFGKEQVLRNQGGLAQKHFNVGDMRNLVVALPPLPEQRAIATALSDVDALLAGLDRHLTKKRDLKQAAMQQLLTGQTRLPGFKGKWEVKRLGDVAMLKNGYAFKSDTYTSLGTFKVITIANVQDGYMTADACSTIASEPADLQPHQRLMRGDILISMTGNVGRVCRVDEDHCLLNQRVGKLFPVGVVEALLFVLLGQPSFISAMTGVAKGGAQPNLSASDITEHTFSIPRDAAEQTAIAGVLTEMDAELAALEQRREKTRALKQAMMQELLTGRTRLV